MRSNRVKYYILLFFYMLIVDMSNAIVVDGFVYKADETPHADVYIRLINVDMPDKFFTDSTNSEGYFSLDIENGIYKVYFVAIGYEKKVYHKNLLISEDARLEDTHLDEQIFVKLGNKFPERFYQDTVYYITEDLRLEAKDQITISGGAKLILMPDVEVSIEGELAIVEEDKTITLTSIDNEPKLFQWSKLFINNSNTEGRLNGLSFSYGNRMVFGKEIAELNQIKMKSINEVYIETQQEVFIKSCKFQNITNGINFSENGTSLIFENNDIRNCDQGIVINSNNTVKIESNRFVNNTQALIIQSDNFESAIVGNNVFMSNRQALRIFSSGVLVLNNVFYENFFDIIGRGLIEIVNNVFSNSDTGSLFLYEDENVKVSESRIAFNQFWNNGFDLQIQNTDGAQTISLGQEQRLNRNGFPCDNDYNIQANPGFLDTVNFKPNPYSPAIDAGENVVEALQLDVAGNFRMQDGNNDGFPFVDMGCFEVEGNDNSEYSLLGRVEYNGVPISKAEVLLYRVEGGDYTAVENRTVNESGYYYFSNLEKGNYLVHAIPHKDSWPQVMPSYFLHSTNWDMANLIDLKGRGVNGNIWLMPYVSNTFGAEELEGIIEVPDLYRRHDDVYEKKWMRETSSPGSLAHITVILKKDNTVIDWTLTSDGGAYVFHNLERGEYEVEIQYPGYRSSTTKMTKDLQGNEIKALEDSDVAATQRIHIYPNPVVNTFFLPSQLESEKGLLQFYNLSGDRVQQNYQESKCVQLKELKPGMYIGIFKTKQMVYRFYFEH